jgi:hypothetical protein
MNCEVAQSELKAYQDGELDRLGAWRVRRHVSRCAPCAEELRTIGALNALLLSADLVEREAPFGSRSKSAAPALHGASPVWRSRRAQWASAGTAVLVAVALAFGTTGRTDALAAAMNAVAQMKNWKSCHLIRRSPGGWTYEQWVRIPEDVHEEVRQNGTLMSVSVQNARESWLYHTDKNVAVHSEDKLMELLDSSGLGTSPGPLRELDRLQEEARRVGGLSVHERWDRLGDGRLVQMIDVRIDTSKHYGRSPGAPPLPAITHWVMYLDAGTGQVLRWDDPDNGETVSVLDYDQPMPDNRFTWKPPAGVKVVEFRGWWQSRKDQKLATAASQEWDVTVHAVDQAANGDVWLTVSERWRGGPVGAGHPISSRWSPEGMTLTDERGRVYVEFMAQMRQRWPDGTLLIGFAPLEPRRPSDPFPAHFTAKLWPDFGSRQGSVHRRQIVTIADLAAPAPAEWIYPPLNPSDAITPPTGWGPLYDDQKERARKGYREGTAW